MSDNHHHHHQNPDHDYVAANRNYFDQEAVRYNDQPNAIKLAALLGPPVLKAYPFDENKTTVLDYACGTGLMSRQLISSVKSILGVDISQGMVDQYNSSVFNQGITPEEMKAVRVELKGEDGELDDQRFDVVVCSMAYHHFADINKTTVILTRYLNPGGMLIVLDIRLEDGLIDGKRIDMVPHRGGMSEDAVGAAFGGAGLTDFTFQDINSGKMHGNEVTFVLATGVKAL